MRLHIAIRSLKNKYQCRTPCKGRGTEYQHNGTLLRNLCHAETNFCQTEVTPIKSYLSTGYREETKYGDFRITVAYKGDIRDDFQA